MKQTIVAVVTVGLLLVGGWLYESRKEREYFALISAKKEQLELILKADGRFAATNVSTWKGRLSVMGSVEKQADVEQLRALMDNAGLHDVEIRVLVGATLEERYGLPRK